MKQGFRTNLFNNSYIVGYHTSSLDTVKTFATQHYTYTDEHIKGLLFRVDRLLAHAHNIANNNKCAFTGEFIGLDSEYCYLLQTSNNSSWPTTHKGTGTPI